jgi:Na+/H+-dicarboxylate symporter
MKSEKRSIVGLLFVNDEQPKLLLMVLGCMFILGSAFGWLVRFPALETFKIYLVPLAGALGGLFIWLLTFFIHPLVASSVWCAVSKNSKSFGIAFVAILFFAVSTALALAWGALAGVMLQPGVGLTFGDNAAALAALPEWYQSFLAFLRKPFNSLWSEIGLLSLIAYMAAKAFIFVPLFPNATIKMNGMFETMQELCMVFMKTILRALPIAVFVMSFNLVGDKGLGFLAEKVGRLLVADVMAMGLHQLSLLLLVYLFVGGAVLRFIKTMFPAYLVAIGSRSSMGTLPTTMKCAERYGIPERISNFIFPFGATVNMDGTCAHIMICLITILQSEGQPITIMTILQVGATVMAASVATAAAPGASISLMKSVIKAVMISLGVGFDESLIPAMVALFASVDFFSDALRTQTNLFGDSMAALSLNRLFEDINWSKYSWAVAVSSKMQGVSSWVSDRLPKADLEGETEDVSTSA